MPKQITEAQRRALDANRNGGAAGGEDLLDTVVVNRPPVPVPKRKRILAVVVAASSSLLLLWLFSRTGGSGGDDWFGDPNSDGEDNMDGDGGQDEQDPQAPDEDDGAEDELPQPTATLEFTADVCGRHALYDPEGAYEGQHWDGIFFQFKQGDNLYNVIATAYGEAEAKHSTAAYTAIRTHSYNADRFGSSEWFIGPDHSEPTAAYGTWPEQWAGLVGAGNYPVVFIPFLAERCADNENGGDQQEPDEGEGDGEGGDQDGETPPDQDGSCPSDPAPTADDLDEVIGALGPFIDNLSVPTLWDAEVYGSFDPYNADDYGFASLLWLLNKHGYYSPGQGGPTGPWAGVTTCTISNSQNTLWLNVTAYYNETHLGNEGAVAPLGQRTLVTVRGPGAAA